LAPGAPDVTINGVTRRATPRRAHPDRSFRPTAVFGFALVHLLALGVFFVGFSWQGVLLCLGSYYLRMFAITAGFHRYFSHRSYRLSRVPQFLLALLGQTAAQKGVLWWAAHHRHHHKFSDLPQDLHSPVQDGFWWSHIGWILSGQFDETRLDLIPDFAKFPELRWLDRNQYAPALLYGLASYLLFGWTGLFWGFFLSTVLLWHGTFSINSVMHVFGRRVFPTRDQSRNSMIFALVTMGEGWHNNHHYYPSSAAQGFVWWQVDFSYYLLWLLERARLVKALRRAPSAAASRILDAARTTKSRLDAAWDAAGESAADRIEQLSKRWDEIGERARASAHEALADLEAARANAAQRVEALQREYFSALERAGSAAEKRLDELRAEIDRARQQLAETLERLVSAAEARLVPSPTLA
jgi:stearoyl-CoA desaturase (delta-9 desaturase)